MIELRGIEKYFPSNGVMALQNASLTLRSGEIHALLGENGTGKSTLMHILAGYIPQTSGAIFLDGRERHFLNSAEAIANGIGMVRQHPLFVRGFRTWEDCVLGAETEDRSHSPQTFHSPGKAQGKEFFGKVRSLFLNPLLAKKRVLKLSAQWGFDLPLEKKTEALTVSQRQKAAVLALLLRDVEWFIFDEPTAVLAEDETKNLFELFSRLRGEGKGLIFITHKLNEALAISDRITVIRRGVTDEARPAKDCSAEMLSDAIFGKADHAPDNLHITPLVTKENTPSVSGKKPILEIKKLRLEIPGLPCIKEINLELMPGKILGIYGIRDSGLETLEKAITGFLPSPKGSIALNGQSIAGKGARAFREAGGAYLGADRLGSCLAPELALYESLIIHESRKARLGFGFFLDMGRLFAWCLDIMKGAEIERAGIEGEGRDVFDKASSFSGGMLQRILLAREFAENASLLVLAEPGSGLDQHRQWKLEEELRDFVRQGKAALLLSTDIDELNSITDNIMTLRNGTLFTAGNGSKAGVSA